MITSDEGTLVFDTNGTPAASAAVLDQSRTLTDRPVRYIVNSHWHWDHWYGAETYINAFPSAQVIAHAQTREMMQRAALAFNAPGIERDLPNYIQNLEKKAAANPALEPTLADDRFFLDQKRSVRHVFPTVTFSDRLTIWLGGPISFALSCYPTGWLRTLETIDALDANVIVPGHGAPLGDKTLLHATMDVFRILLREGRAAHERRTPVDEARAAIMPQLKGAMATITGGDAKATAAFEVQLVDWYLHRVYDELDGPLTNAIAPIPRS